MRTICAWCDAVIKEGDETMVKGTSHGICEACLAKEIAKLDAEDAAKRQAARDNAAPADTPRGARVDR